MPRSSRGGFFCPYCGSRMKLKKIQAKEKERVRRWVCSGENCNASVGCHPGKGNRPLGLPARKKLRMLRQLVHEQLDPLWTCGVITRKQAYRLLADELKIDIFHCHVGKFDEEMCQKALEALAKIKGKG